MSKFQKIIFQGDEFLLTSDPGPIATESQFRNGHSAYACLFQNGCIMRHGEVIGFREDIEFVGEVDIDLSIDDLVNMLSNMLSGNGWIR